MTGVQTCALPISKTEMTLSGGRLWLFDRDTTRGLSLPIDRFFASLATDAGDRAIGVILSGTGSDGSRGIRDIHDAGGLVVVQDDHSAKFDGMPRSSIDTGLADMILAPEQMPEALLAYVANPLTGRRTETVIDATWGLGEALVSGQVEPDQYVVETATGRILNKHIGAKALAIYSQAGGGVKSVIPTREQEQALTDDTIGNAF